LGNNTISGPVVMAGPATSTALAVGYGNTTITGPLSLGFTNTSNITGNGNLIVSGLISSFENATDRFIKSQTNLATSLWLQNANNNFLSSVNISAGFLRVSDGGALGRNTISNVQYAAGGTLEVRADAATIPTFANKTISLAGGNTTYMVVDRALGGSGIGQTITFGSFTFGQPNRNFYLYGRNGYSLSVGTYGDMGGSGNNNTNIYNLSSGWMIFNGSATIGDNTTARAFSVNTNSGGHGDVIFNGSIFSTSATRLDGLTKSGQGLLIATGTASNYKGITAIQQGVLQIGTFGMINGSTLYNSMIALGSAALPGVLNYAGSAGETSAKLLNLAGSTGAGMLLANQGGATALEYTAPVIATGGGAKSLVLGGTSTALNKISGLLTDGTIASGSTSLFKVENGTWVYAPTLPAGATLVAGTVTGGTAFTTSVALTAGVGTLYLSSAAGVVPGMTITGTNIPAGIVVTAVSGTMLYLSGTVQNTVASGTAITIGTLTSYRGNLTVTAGTLRLQQTNGTTAVGTDLLGGTSQVIFAADSGKLKPHHVEGDCHCACDDASESSGSQVEPQLTSTRSAAVARDSPT
jgi:autotransporter-associated beta strand protein